LSDQPSTPERTPGPPRASSGSEYSEVLSGIMKHDKQREAARARAAKKQKPKSRGNQSLMAGILVLVSGYLWFGQPAFLEQPPPPPIPPALEVAGLRMEMTQYVIRVQRFFDQNGRLPETLAEAAEEREGFVFEVRGEDSFTLIGNSSNYTIMYDSSQAIEELLGDAREIIERGVSG
jgi:hypothetical protein